MSRWLLKQLFVYADHSSDAGRHHMDQLSAFAGMCNPLVGRGRFTFVSCARGRLGGSAGELLRHSEFRSSPRTMSIADSRVDTCSPKQSGDPREGVFQQNRPQADTRLDCVIFQSADVRKRQQQLAQGNQSMSHPCLDACE